MDHQLAFILFFHLLPGGDYQNIIDIELVEILLPVIYPVHVLCLGFLYGALSHVHVGAHLLQLFLYLSQHFCRILFFLQVKRQKCRTIILRHLGQDVHKHLLLVLAGKRHFVLYLYSLDPQVHQHTADNIFCLCRRFQAKLIPFHRMKPSL